MRQRCSTCTHWTEQLTFSHQQEASNSYYKLSSKAAARAQQQQVGQAFASNSGTDVAQIFYVYFSSKENRLPFAEQKVTCIAWFYRWLCT